jgi:drug/metabolite transporter (DMT)-like permease
MDGHVKTTSLNTADLAALLVATIWGTNFVFLKALLEQFDVATFMFLRYAGMLMVAWLVLFLRPPEHPPAGAGAAHRPGLWSLDRADLRRLALSGILGYACYIPLSTYGLNFTTAFSSALLIATAPIFAALQLRWLRLERTVPAQWIAMVVAFAGVVVFLLEKSRAGLQSAGMGDLISLAGAFFFAAYTVTNKPLLARYPASAITAYTLTIGALPVLAISLPSAFAQDWGRVTAAGWTGLAWSIIAPVYFAWTVWSWASARLGVGRTSVFMYLVPVVGGVTSWLLLGEGFGPLKVGGAGVILAGLALARRAPGRTMRSGPWHAPGLKRLQLWSLRR